MEIINRIKKKIAQLLKLQPAPEQSVMITEAMSLENNILKNRILYRGSSYEINQFFASVENYENRFWGNCNSKIRKIHIGVSSETIDRYADIVSSDINGISVDKDADKWDKIAQDNDFDKLVEQALKNVLAVGDGAFKISYDTNISQYPILEFVPADYIDFTYKRGRFESVVFYTEFTELNKKFRLTEIYGYGYIRYKLYSEYGSELPLNYTMYTQDLEDIEFDSSIIMAVPFKVFESTRYIGRGKALFDDKTEEIDGLDEIASQWLDSVRKGRAKKYIPESLIPRSDTDGHLLAGGFDFADDFVKVAGTMAEEAHDQIQVVQPQINYNAYVESYASFLDMLLQGIISPATLGIDLKRTDNALAQREKEKVTLYVRGKITAELESVLQKLIATTLNVDNMIHKKSLKDYEVSVSFGEYASTDFASVVQTVGLAKAQGIMSVEMAVNELYGDTLTDKEKAEEVERIKQETGLSADQGNLFGDLPV